MDKFKADDHMKEEAENSVEKIKAIDDSNEPFDLKDIIENIVGVGPWHWIGATLIMLSIPSTPTFPVFANSVPYKRCALDNETEQYIVSHNLSIAKVGPIIGPWYSNNTHSNLNGCYKYNETWTSELFDERFNWTEQHHPSMNRNESSIISCPNGYVYEINELQYPGSVVIEFDTVCEYNWLVPLGSSFYFFGLMIGFIICGWISDQIGRKKSALIFTSLEIVFGICTSFSPNYTCYILSRTVVGAVNAGKLAILNVLIMETTCLRSRLYFVAMMGIGYNWILRSLISLFAYFISNWRWLNLVVMAPSLLGILYIYVLVESPVWLLSKNRVREALASVQFMYKINNLCILDDKFAKLDELFSGYEEQIDKGQLADRKRSMGRRLSAFLQTIWIPFSTWEVVKRVILGTLLFNGQSMVFFGLLLYSRKIKVNIYLLTFINSTTILPGTVFSISLFRFVKQRRLLICIVNLISFVVLALGGLYSVIYQPKSDIFMAVTSNVALIFLSSSLFMLYIFIPELFAPSMRSECFGIASGVGRVGTITSTFINEIGDYYSHGMPFLVYAVVVILQNFFVWLTPDTNGVSCSEHGNNKKTKNESLTHSHCDNRTIELTYH